MEPPAAAAVPAPVVSSGRNPGVKFLIVCGLALLMAIPAIFVFTLLGDRTRRAEQVTTELGQVLGGPQTFIGPVIALPYTEPVKPPASAPGAAPQPQPGPRQDVLLLFPAEAHVSVRAASEVRRRSLFRVPVYRAALDFTAHFDATPLSLPPGATVDWSRAEILVGASEPRGAQADATVRVGAAVEPLTPAILLADSGLQAPDAAADAATQETIRFFGAPLANPAPGGGGLDASVHLAFSGAQRLAVLAYGQTSTLDVSGDWPHPSFDGAFLPLSHRIDAKGFSASWKVPFIARGVPAYTLSGGLPRLGRAVMGVSFAQPADPYHSVARSLKYALLFVSLVFLTYFIFETTTGVAVHPAQYVLVGLSQIVFYLLLLSIAEHLGFDAAFVIAAGATVGLIGLYAGQVFRSRAKALQALVAFAALYAGIYVLMRLEDYALLIGAVAAFAAIAAVMYFTRGIDWYGAGHALMQPRRPNDPAAEA